MVSTACSTLFAFGRAHFAGDGHARSERRRPGLCRRRAGRATATCPKQTATLATRPLSPGHLDATATIVPPARAKASHAVGSLPPQARSRSQGARQHFDAGGALRRENLENVAFAVAGDGGSLRENVRRDGDAVEPAAGFLVPDRAGLAVPGLVHAPRPDFGARDANHGLVRDIDRDDGMDEKSQAFSVPGEAGPRKS